MDAPAVEAERRSAHWVLGAITLGAGLWFVLLAGRWQPGFDEWWHIWFGEIDDWRLFLREVSYDTHPPTLSLLVRMLSAPGDSPLWARSMAILPAVATLPVFYRLCRNLELTTPVALLTTAIYGFSHTFASLAISLRSYALANLFLITALAALVPIIRQPARPARAQLWLGVLGILGAAGTLYIALLPGLVALGFLLWLWLQAHRSGARLEWLARPGPWVVLALGLATELAFYRLTCHPPVPTFIGEHVLPGDGDALAFALAGFNANLAYFTPFAPEREDWLAAAVVILVGSALLARSIRAGHWSRVMILTSLPVLVVFLAVAGILRQYPWGGNARHQFVLFLPLLLGTMFALDAAYRRAGRGKAFLLVLVALAAAAVSRRSYAGPHLDDFRSEPIWASDYAALAQRVRAGDQVIVPRYAQIGLYARARDESGWRWLGTTKRDGLYFDRFAARIGGKEVTVLLDQNSYCLPRDPDPTWGEQVEDLLSASGARGAWLFTQTPFDRQGSVPTGLGARAARALEVAGVHSAEVLEFQGGALLRLDRP